MTERRIGLFWPLGARVFLMAAAAVFGVTLLRTSKELSWPFQEWAHTNILFEGAGLDLTGPLVAAFGAFLSGRLTPPRRLYALPRFPREPAQFLAQNLVPAALVTTAAYLLGLAPAVARTFQTATAGSLNPVNVVSGVLVLNALLAVGWLIGLLAQSAFAALIAFAVAFAATLASYAVGAWSAVTPVIAFGGAVRYRETTALMTFRLCFFLAVMLVALLTAGLILSGRGFDRRPPKVQHMLWWLLPAAFVAVAIVKPVPDFSWESHPSRSCKQVDGLEYCVHEAHLWALDPFVEEMEPAVALVGRDNVPFDRIYDAALADETSQQSDPRVLYADVSARYGVAGARSQILDRVAATEVCFARYGNQEIQQVTNAFHLSVRLNNGRDDIPDDRFSRLSDDQLRQWLTEHRRQASSCDITDDLLP